MSRSLVIGAAGQVGENLVRTLRKRVDAIVLSDLDLDNPGVHRLDIRASSNVLAFIGAARPEIVYLAAANANVDDCENRPQESYEVNVLGVKNVIEAANAVGARLVFFSSDYIFDGKSGPYAEGDAPRPINEYGRQKLSAEHLIALFAPDYLIIRTTVVFGWERRGRNFVARLLRSLANNEPLFIPADQIGTPTYAPNLAQATIELAESGSAGVFNIVGTAAVSRFGFACEAARIFGMEEGLIQPVHSNELHQAARRPLNAGLTTDKVRHVLHAPLLSFREGLEKMEREQRGAGKSRSKRQEAS